MAKKRTLAGIFIAGAIAGGASTGKAVQSSMTPHRAPVVMTASAHDTLNQRAKMIKQSLPTGDSLKVGDSLYAPIYLFRDGAAGVIVGELIRKVGTPARPTYFLTFAHKLDITEDRR